jgi:hypothetical protein
MGWRVTSSIFAVLVLAAGTLSTASWLARRTEVQDQAYRRPLGQIVLDVGAGDVTLLPGGPGVTVHRHLTWSWTKPTISEVWDGSTLRITARCPVASFAPRCAVDYVLRVSDNARVTSHTTSGDVTLRGWAGDLSLSTTSGGITGSDLASGQVEAHTRSGDVTLAFARAPSQVTATTRSGGVAVTVPPGDRYRLHTGSRSGSVTARVTGDPASTRSIEVMTGSGDIHIGYE